jgi:hypothetical protein
MAATEIGCQAREQGPAWYFRHVQRLRDGSLDETGVGDSGQRHEPDAVLEGIERGNRTSGRSNRSRAAARSDSRPINGVGGTGRLCRARDDRGSAMPMGRSG